MGERTWSPLRNCKMMTIKLSPNDWWLSIWSSLFYFSFHEHKNGSFASTSNLSLANFINFPTHRNEVSKAEIISLEGEIEFIAGKRIKMEYQREFFLFSYISFATGTDIQRFYASPTYWDVGRIITENPPQEKLPWAIEFHPGGTKGKAREEKRNTPRRKSPTSLTFHLLILPSWSFLKGWSVGKYQR